MAKHVENLAEKPEATAIVKAPISTAMASSLNLEKAVAMCRDNPEQAGQLVMALLTKNTTLLPGTTFARRDGEILRSYRTAVPLAESKGHLLQIKRQVTGQDGKKQTIVAWDFTVNALRELNKVASLQVIKPETVVVDGKKQMNPYIQINPDSRMPEVVYCRALCVGYSSHGSLVATDAMVRLDCGIYLLESIQAKVRWLKDDEDKFVCEYGLKGEPPTDGDVKRPGKWVFLPVHSVGGIGLWINLANKILQQTLADHTTRLKFIERLAQSFAERNALKAHPAMPKSCDAVNGSAHVVMTGWTTDFDRKDLESLRQLVETDHLEDFKDSQIKIERVQTEQLDETDVQIIEADASEIQSVESHAGEGDPKADSPVTSEDLLGRAIEVYQDVVDAKTESKAKSLLRQVDPPIQAMEEATPEQLKAFIEAAELLLKPKEG